MLMHQLTMEKICGTHSRPGVSDAGAELYIMEQFYDYRMTEERSVVEQAHEI